MISAAILKVLSPHSDMLNSCMRETDLAEAYEPEVRKLIIHMAIEYA